MSSKQSVVAKYGIPLQAARAVLTLAAVSAASPYLGGADFGLFSIPALPAATGPVLQWIGPPMVLLIAACFAPLLPIAAGRVGRDSKYVVQTIVDIVKAEAGVRGVNLNGILIDDDFSILDLERMAGDTWYPHLGRDGVRDPLRQARARAFTEKYSQPREDEKLVSPQTIKFDGIRPWHEYFLEVLRDIGIPDIQQIGQILDVGIGNGYSMKDVWGRVGRFHGIDISQEALTLAKGRFPHMKADRCEAEELNKKTTDNRIIVENGSVDLYVSLRTYQSSLFDRRAALHEAYRVLAHGGKIVLSVPIMYLQSDGTVLQGLLRRRADKPSMEFAEEFVNELAKTLDILNFRKVKTHDLSPFEIYVTAER